MQKMQVQKQKKRDKEMELGNLSENLGYEDLITKYSIRYGDISLDNEIKYNDITILKAYLEGKKELPDQAKLNADVNNDGKINNDDLINLKYFGRI